jgi:CRISPR-associated endonuclease Csn1
MKRILGLDLGTTSIGWAYVIEGENQSESEIKQIGARIIQYDNFDKVDKSGKVSESKNPEQDFASGKGLSPNAGRTLKRGARRTLDRYQLRRENLIDALTKGNVINAATKLNEDGKQTTFQTWELRAKAAKERIELDEFARVLLAINKKRGYKSSRKAKNEDDGQAIDGMGIAKKLYEGNLTRGQYVFQLMQSGKEAFLIFIFDLQNDFDKVWNYQNNFNRKFLQMRLQDLKGKTKSSSAMFWNNIISTQPT